MDADAIARSLQEFLAESPAAVVVEGGEVIFDFSTASFSCSTERGKCLLHLWSDERNTVRRVLDAEIKHDVLCLQAQRFGQSRPVLMEICRNHGRRPRALLQSHLYARRTVPRKLELGCAGSQRARGPRGD